MFNVTVDPIALLESANAKFPHASDTLNKKTEPEHSAPSPEIKVNMDDRNQILKLGKLYLDSPYQLGATGTKPGEATDCSQFTQTIFAQAGIELERNSSDQAQQFSNGGYWYDDLDLAEIGDLLFFKNTYDAGPEREITHVGIYAGEGKMLHAGGDKVQISLIDAYWKSHFKGVGSFKYLGQKFNKEKAQKNYSLLNSLPISENITSQPTVTPSLPVKQDEKPSPVEQNETLISLDSSRLDAVGKKFFEEWDIKLKGDSSSQLRK